MKKLSLSVLLLSLWACDHVNVKNQVEKNGYDKKCSVLLDKIALAKISLDSCEQSISMKPCSSGPNCQSHGRIHLERDSLSLILDDLNKEFVTELQFSSKEYRKNHYTNSVKTLEDDLSLKAKALNDLELGLNGYSKCVAGADCRLHYRLYEERDECKKQIDSLTRVIKTIE